MKASEIPDVPLATAQGWFLEVLSSLPVQTKTKGNGLVFILLNLEPNNLFQDPMGVPNQRI